MKKQSGFTLIELVMVIVILGILAAVAIPKFIDLSSNARTAAIQGAAGALSSASAINYAAAVLGNSGSTAVTGDSAADALMPAANFGTEFGVSSYADSCSTMGQTVAVTLSHAGSSDATASATIICTG